MQPKHLNELEAKLYDFVVKRFLAAFYPPAEFTITTRITRVADEPFKSEGKVMVAPGWLAVYGKETAAEEGTLTPVKPGEKVATDKIEVAANQTRPPARLTEATLLSAMEGAGKLIDDEELREAMREKGLGTPATRAQIIEGLLTEKYILREGKELQPTAKAFSLIALLRGLGVPELFSPELTAEWEFKLAQMEHGKLARATFMREIVAMTEHIVGQAKQHESDTIPGDFATLGVPCPKCGGEVHENYKKFQCQACDFGFWKIMGGRQLDTRRGGDAACGAPRRPARRLPQPPGTAVLGVDQAVRRERGLVRFSRARRRRRRGRGFQRAGAARRVPQVRQPRVRGRRNRMSARRPSARTRPAISAPAA